MDDERLDAIAARLAAATPGPWQPYPWAGAWRVVPAYESSLEICDTGSLTHNAEEDATFIAHAPADIRSLLDELARLRTLTGGQVEALTRRLGILKSENESLRAQLAVLRDDEPEHTAALDDAMDTIAALRAALARATADERRPHLGEM